MCRYMRFGNDYRTHWACIPCRWTAKHPTRLDMRWQGPGGPRCPRCRQPMANMGRDFKAPRRLDTVQWRKLALLVAAGITFDSCGCNGPGWRPRTLADTKRFLASLGRPVGPGRTGFRWGEWEDRHRTRL